MLPQELYSDVKLFQVYATALAFTNCVRESAQVQTRGRSINLITSNER